MRRSAAPSFSSAEKTVRHDRISPRPIIDGFAGVCESRNESLIQAQSCAAKRPVQDILDLMRDPSENVDSEVCDTRSSEARSVDDEPVDITNLGDVTDARYFEVLWCKKSTRKHKKWEGDGVLEIHQRSMTLKSMEGELIAQASGGRRDQADSVSDGDVLSVGGKEVEIQCRVDARAFKTTCTLPPTDEHTQSASKQSVSAAAARSCKMRRFVSPLLDGGATAATKAAQHHARFDPAAPGALVLTRPSQQYQWQHNRSGASLVDVVVDPHVSRHLRPHQRAGVQFLYARVMGFGSGSDGAASDDCGAILADEMGLGKTVQCLALIWTMLRQGPFAGRPVVRRVLIVTPSSLVHNWVREASKWLGSERLTLYAVDKTHSAASFSAAAGGVWPVMVISYEMLVRSVSDVQQAGVELIICDEGHRLKNANVKVAAALRSLSCERRIVLTGTPVQNDLGELFSLAQFVCPRAFGTHAEFQRRFALPIERGSQPSADAEAAQLGSERSRQLSAVISGFVLRRTHSVLSCHLPPKVETTVFCRASPQQLAIYRQLLASRGLQQQLQPCSTSAGSWASTAGVSPLAYIALLRKLCNHPGLLRQRDLLALSDDVSVECADDVISLSDVTQSGKLAVLVSILRSMTRGQRPDKIVLISYFTQTLDMLSGVCTDLGLSCLRLDGSTAVSQRQTLVDKFNSVYCNDAVFLLSAKAGGVGLNLTAASRIVLYDLDWNPANDLQALARVWRDGQRNTALVYRLVTSGTIEEKIYQRQISKQSLSASVLQADSVKSQAGHNTQFSLQELRELFSINEEATCDTHVLLQCQCDCAGGPRSGHDSACEQDERNERRACQLGDTDTMAPGEMSRATGMDQLLNWQHYSPPFNTNVIQDAGVTEAGDWVTFIFRHVTDSQAT